MCASTNVGPTSNRAPFAPPVRRAWVAAQESETAAGGRDGFAGVLPDATRGADGVADVGGGNAAKRKGHRFRGFGKLLLMYSKTRAAGTRSLFGSDSVQVFDSEDVVEADGEADGEAEGARCPKRRVFGDYRHGDAVAEIMEKYFADIELDEDV